MRERGNNTSQQQITAGLGRTLFLTFLLLALGPLSIVSYISYQNATASLRQEAIGDLRAAMEYKLKFIEKYFSSMVVDIELQSELFFNIKVLQSVTLAFKESGMPVREFIATIEWEAINTEEGGALRSFQKAHNYQDVYLVDLKGNILYSGSEEHLGVNILSNEYNGTKLGDAYRATLKTGEPVLSDYGYHGAGEKSLSLFLAKAVEDDETGEKIGVLIFELPYTHLDTFMQTHFGLGASGETYLVGTDLLIRSNLRSFEEAEILKTRIDTELLNRWREEHEKWHQLQKQTPDTPLPRPKSTQEMAYTNYQGVSVLGMYSTLDFLGELGFHWVLVAEMNEEEAFSSAASLKKIVITLLIFTSVLVLLLSWFIVVRLVAPLRQLTQWSQRVADGDLTIVEITAPANEIGQLNSSFRKTVKSLRRSAEENKRYNWLRAGQLELDDQLRGDPTLIELSQKIITYITLYLEAQIGALYINDGDTLRLLASYAYRTRKNLASQFRLGEGMVGQAAVEQQPIIITNVPDDYIHISSGLGEKRPNNILLVPFMYNNTVKAVMEVGTFSSFTELQVSFVEGISDKLAVTINGAQSRNQLQKALAVTTEQADILQSQQEELQAANEELEEQAQRLRASEEELQANQDQLVSTNEQLEDKNKSLNRQKRKIEQANKKLTLSRVEIERKAEEVARTSKYKSEFLANMSHELRTPLNSLLLLAQTLKENRQGNLTEDDIESVGVIHNSGKELLSLINDILDISKIEAGHMMLVQDLIPITELFAELKRTFRHLAEEKGLALYFNVARDTPPEIESDRQRLDQILKNILSNAVKFTDKGRITVSVSPVHPDTELRRRDLSPRNTIAIAVQDSGVGIPEGKQKIIFEAFRQADGSTARKYGGTGLGLSISRELASLLGGEIQLTSKENEGSTFTLYLPVLPQGQNTDNMHNAVRSNGSERLLLPKDLKTQPIRSNRQTATQYIDDDRHELRKNDQIILVIEDDPRFAGLLVRQCHEKDLKCIAVSTGEEGLRMAMSHLPAAIILDLKLPGISGWKVLEDLKEKNETRHIPVHIISAEDAGVDARHKGAVDALKKPVNKERLEIAFLNIQQTAHQNIKNLLVADHDAGQRKDIITLIGNNDVHSEEASSGREAMKKLRNGQYDCLIMGLDFADMTSLSLLKQLNLDKVGSPPIIIYTDKKLSWEETAEFRQYACSIIIKGVMSEERLLDESALFLHRMISNLPERKQRMIRNLHEDDAVFQGKRILLVDDDMRNTFALAKVLRDKGMETVKAEDGVSALKILEREEKFDLVLMDIMMPVMDGYETIKRIRGLLRFKALPIIALTAKAMKGDRSRCLTAGANDYLAKPVDMERLIALLRLWLYC